MKTVKLPRGAGRETEPENPNDPLTPWRQELLREKIRALLRQAEPDVGAGWQALLDVIVTPDEALN
jgi:hypothetical protein